MITEQYQADLRSLRIAVDVKNNGNHLIVEGPHGYIDVWPTTGKWISRTSKKEGFGLRSLIQYVTGEV